MSVNEKQSEFIETMYRQMYPQLLNYSYNAFQNYSMAQEAVNEAFRIACEKPDEFMNSPNPKGWITLTLKYAIKNILRNKVRIQKTMFASISAGQAEPATSRDDAVSLDAMYSNIIDPEDYRLLKLVILERWSLLEAAEEFGISLEACKKRVQRAKKKMKQKLTEADK